jgi:hypothetical protein
MANEEESTRKPRIPAAANFLIFISHLAAGMTGTVMRF